MHPIPPETRGRAHQLLHRSLQRLPAAATLRRLQRLMDCYDPADFLDDLHSDLVKIVTPERFVRGLLGIDMVPAVVGTLPSSCVAHVSSRLSQTAHLVELLDIRETDEFWDLGCGMGGVAMLVGWLTGARVHGVEFHREYCDCATHAAHAFRLPRVTFHHADARELDYAGGTKFFLFTPFTGPVLDSVMDRLRVVAVDHPITVGWAGPRSHLEGQTWLHEVDPVGGGDAFALKIYRSSDTRP